MKKSIVFIIMLAFFLPMLSGCLQNRIDTSHEGELEDSIKRLEEKISEEFGLEEFELNSVHLGIKKGRFYKYNNGGCGISIFGTYQLDGEPAYLSKSYDITKTDYNIFGTIYDGVIIYNNESDNKNNPIKEIYTDTPAWAIESLYSIMFD